MKKRKMVGICLLLLLCCLLSDSALAQTVNIPGLASNVGQQAISRPLLLIFLLAGIAILPFVVMMTTAFVKVAVVLAMVRNALGTQQIPPNPIITGLAMILTIYIMIPVGLDIYRAAGQTINQGSSQPVLSQMTISLMTKAVGEAKEPVRAFLEKQAHPKEKGLFYNLGKKMRTVEDRDQVSEHDFTVLVPAFVISELKEAFQIGFILFLPFLVIDVVVTNILLSLGMFQISPITISLPFKLLLFVLVDGWHLIAKGLILGYT